MSSSADNEYFIALGSETTPGVVNATPTWNRFDYTSGITINYASDTRASEVNKGKRAGNGHRKTNYRVDGTFETDLYRCAPVDQLFESLLSNSFNSGTGELKGGKDDRYTSILKRLWNGNAATYYNYGGIQAISFSLSVTSTTDAAVSFELLGMTQVIEEIGETGATYPAVVEGPTLGGEDVTAFEIDGLDVTFRSLELTIEQNRETLDRLGSATPIGLGTADPRAVTLSGTAYLAGTTAHEVLATDDPMPVTFTIGTAGNGYRVTLPSACSTLPTHEVDGSKNMFQFSFTAKYDATEETDIIIEKI